MTGRASRPVKNPDSAISKVLTHSFGGLWGPTRPDIDIIPRKNNRLVKQKPKAVAWVKPSGFFYEVSGVNMNYIAQSKTVVNGVSQATAGPADHCLAIY